jgi:hypothetical protein
VERSSVVVVRMKHLRAAGMCNREPRLFFKQQGWSWQEFLDHGLPVEQVEASGDPMALRVAAIAREEAARVG